MSDLDNPKPWESADIAPAPVFDAPPPQTARTEPNKKPNRKGFIFAVIFVGVLVGLGILPRIRQSTALNSARSDLKDAPEPVNVVRPFKSPANEDLSLPSSVQAIEETTIYARTAGYLHQLFVDIGSHVKAGQLLATIESPEIDQQVAESQANVAKEQASGQESNADVFRLQAGVAAARAQISESRSELDSAIADVAHMAAKLTESQGAENAAKAKLVEATHRLEGAKASLGQYVAKESLADKTYTRWKELALGGAVSGQDLDEAEAGYETSLSAVTEAQAAVESARADVVSATSDVQSRAGDVKAAIADETSSQQKVRTARSALLSSQANLRAAQAAVQAGEANVLASTASIQSSQSAVKRLDVLRSFENVTAPFPGVITARNVDVGSLIGAGSGTAEGASDPQSTVPHGGMFGLARTDVLRVQVNVPQDFIDEIHKGDPADLTCNQYPGVRFHGRVFDTAGALDTSSRTLLVEVRLDNPDLKLIPGMFTQVHFQLHHKHPILRLASDALIIDSAGVRVAEVTPKSTIHFQQVKLGKDYGKEVEVVSGLDSTAQIVDNPSDDLVEGQTVRVVSNAKP